MLIRAATSIIQTWDAKPCSTRTNVPSTKHAQSNRSEAGKIILCFTPD